MVGLFGSLGGASSTASAAQPAAQGVSLSGLGGGTTSNAAAATSTPSLFGLAARAQQPAASTLGQTQQQNAASQTQAPQNAQNPAASNGPAGTSHSAYFDSLLEKSRKRQHRATDEASTLGELPSLQLGLGDISQRVRELAGGSPLGKRGKAVDSKAHYLLAASGISPGSALRDLNELNAQAQASGAGPQAPAFDTDNEAYLSSLQSQSTLALIAEGLNRSAQDFDRYLEENVTMEWDAQRQRIYEHFGLAPKGASAAAGASAYGSPGPVQQGSFGRSSRRGRGQKPAEAQPGTAGGSVFGASGPQRSVIGTPGRAGAGQATLFADVDKGAGTQGSTDERFVRERQAKFAEKVQRLNEARLEDKVYPVLQEFGTVEAQAGGDQTSQLVDAYKALIEMTGEDATAVSASEPNAIKERQFASDYLADEERSARKVRTNTRILDGARRFLEKSFFHSLEATVAKNPREARLGGVPTTLNKVRAYVTLRASKRDLAPESTDLQSLNDELCWVIIFYLLRSGRVREAVEYVKENAVAFRAIDRNFPTYMANYHKNESRRLDDGLQERVNAEYNQRSRIAPENSVDPYRMACYKIVGRCDLAKRSLDLVGQGIEDWIWLQFNLARESHRLDEAAGEAFGLAEVRAVIREIGQRYFGKGADSPGGHGTFFLLQVLGGMFEQAVAYLYPFSYVSAVHFAIALDFYGLLRVSGFAASESELLTFTVREQPQINFGRMVGYYTRDFRAARAEVAVDYLTLICLDSDLPGQAGRSQAALCHEALRELVLETREFTQLLGDIRTDGQRVKGAIERRLRLVRLADQEELLRTVTLQAAGVADDNGRTSDAVLLYHLAEDYDGVIGIINRALSDAVAVDLGVGEQARVPAPRPRAPDAGTGGTGGTSSLSLTAVDGAAELARNMIGLYNGNALYFGKIRPANRDACGVLLRMTEAKQHVEGGRWSEALDIIESLAILPLSADGQIHVIRARAQAFGALPPPVARNVGSLLTWTITCCGRQREALRASAFEDATRARLQDELAGKARDLMVFAGLVRLRLPPRVFEVIARAGQEVESW
ncbi:MAG: hypothetical protein M1832_000702 [Thelocarpon impressellum]|nr:MAG: hypothetical protein M1832_000702 [Thelocarpon impressellum]